MGSVESKEAEAFANRWNLLIFHVENRGMLEGYSDPCH